MTTDITLGNQRLLQSNLRELDLDLLQAMRAGLQRSGDVYSMDLASKIHREIVRRARAQFRAARKRHGDWAGNWSQS